MKDVVVRARIDRELKAQARDHELAARGEMPPAATLLLRPKRLQGAVVEWPDASLIDD